MSPEEGQSTSAAASAALGEAAGSATTPAAKIGVSHNPAKGKHPLQEKPPTQHPFILGEGLPPVPAKLVAKICRGEFVDMAELLRDNIEAERRQGSDTGCSSGGGKPRRREIPDILSWIQCFGTYACVLASQRPEKLTQLLAYQTTVVREARRCGGTGWQGYDTMFRQHAANTEKETDWSQLNNSLYAVTFLAQQNGRGKTCELCLETDHMAADCALAPARPKELQQAAHQGPPGLGAGLFGFRRSGNNRDIVPRGDPGTGRSRGPIRVQAERVCYSWNDGTCRFQPNCRYRHECARCGGDHRAVACPLRQPPARMKESPGRRGV